MCKDTAVQENSFKVGDKVRVVKSNFGAPELQPGVTGTVLEAFEEGASVQIEGAPKPIFGGPGWNFFNDELELVS